MPNKKRLRRFAHSKLCVNHFYYCTYGKFRLAEYYIPSIIRAVKPLENQHVLVLFLDKRVWDVDLSSVRETWPWIEDPEIFNSVCVSFMGYEIRFGECDDCFEIHHFELENYPHTDAKWVGDPWPSVRISKNAIFYEWLVKMDVFPYIAPESHTVEEISEWLDKHPQFNFERYKKYNNYEV